MEFQRLPHNNYISYQKTADNTDTLHIKLSATLELCIITCAEWALCAPRHILLLYHLLLILLQFLHLGPNKLKDVKQFKLVSLNLTRNQTLPLYYLEEHKSNCSNLYIALLQLFLAGVGKERCFLFCSGGMAPANASWVSLQALDQSDRYCQSGKCCSVDSQHPSPAYCFYDTRGRHSAKYPKI